MRGVVAGAGRLARGFARPLQGGMATAYSSGPRRVENRLWVVPGLNVNVKFERLIEGGRSDGEIVELVYCKQHI